MGQKQIEGRATVVNMEMSASNAHLVRVSDRYCCDKFTDSLNQQRFTFPSQDIAESFVHLIDGYKALQSGNSYEKAKSIWRISLAGSDPPPLSERGDGEDIAAVCERTSFASTSLDGNNPSTIINGLTPGSSSPLSRNIVTTTPPVSLSCEDNQYEEGDYASPTSQ